MSTNLAQLIAHGFAKLTGAQRQAGATQPLTATASNTVVLPSGDQLTKAHVGLPSADDTGDADKPVSTAQQTALNAKVTGPAAAADNALARFDGTTGKLVQNSGVTVDDAGNATFGGVINAPELRSIGEFPMVVFQDTNAGIDLKCGRWVYSDGTLRFEAINDSLSSVIRTPIVVSSANVVSFEGSLAIGTQSGSSEAKIEIGNGRTASGVAYIDLVAVAGADYNVRILRWGGANDNLNIENTGSGSITLIGNSAERFAVRQTDGLAQFLNSIGFGYGAGSGGSVTQPTDKSTTVTINKPSMLITTSNIGLGAGSSIGFQVNNSVVGLHDQVVPTFVGTLASFHAKYSVRVAVGNGVFFVHLTNHSGSTLSEAVPIKFDVIKGSTT